jgi:hypothetical protein
MIEAWLLIKFIAIAYVSVLHVIVAITLSRIIDKIIPEIEVDETTKLEPRLRCVTLLFINILVAGIAAYLIRNVVEKIPFPLDGKYGYKHSMLKETKGIVVSGYLLMYYQTKLKQRFDMLLLDKPLPSKKENGNCETFFSI